MVIGVDAPMVSRARRSQRCAPDFQPLPEVLFVFARGMRRVGELPSGFNLPALEKGVTPSAGEPSVLRGRGVQRQRAVGRRRRSPAPTRREARARAPRAAPLVSGSRFPQCAVSLRRCRESTAAGCAAWSSSGHGRGPRSAAADGPFPVHAVDDRLLIEERQGPLDERRRPERPYQR